MYGSFFKKWFQFFKILSILMKQTVPDKQAPDSHQKLFPHDLTMINQRGLHLAQHSYCLYRVTMLIAISILFTLLLLYGPELKNWAYLTYWGFTGTLLYFLLGVIDSMAVRAWGKKLRLPLWKALHWMFPSLLIVELMINGVFWFVFFPFIIYYHRSSHIPLLVIDVVQAFGAHLVPLSLLLIDMYHNLICFWNRQMRKYTVIILLTYLSFNMIYTIEEGPIYPVLTYRDILTYIFVLGNVVGTFIAFEIVFVLSKKFKNKKVLTLLKTNTTPTITITKQLPSITEKYHDFIEEGQGNPKTQSILAAEMIEVSKTVNRIKLVHVRQQV